MSRFYVLLEEEITQERAELSIKQHMAPHEVEFTKTEWFSSYEGEFWIVQKLPSIHPKC